MLKTAGLYGRVAANFVKPYGFLVGEITHGQQVSLFEKSFATYILTAKRIYLGNVKNDVKFESISPKIKDIFYDTLYQGNSTAKEMVYAISTNNKNKVVLYIKKYQPGNGTGRDNLRVRHLR